MLSDKQLIDLMIKEPSWEDVILKIVAEEGMQPWNIDLVKLADVFIDYLNRMEQLDLRVPARFVLVTAILLRMKSDVLVEKRVRSIIPESDKPLSAELERLARLPPLQPPVVRMPVSNVSVEELLTALRKAFEVSERRIEKKERIRQRVHAAMPPQEEENISERIDRLFNRIQSALQEIQGTVEFSKLLKGWERREIIRTLLPMLHLSQEGKIKYEQPELFKEIYIELKKKGEKKVEEKQKGDA
ncbi:MAG: segregation/condensation protein A [Candidatus Aenigmatarchaeota archaeon]